MLYLFFRSNHQHQLSGLKALTAMTQVRLTTYYLMYKFLLDAKYYRTNLCKLKQINHFCRCFTHANHTQSFDWMYIWPWREQSIYYRTGAKLYCSERNGNSDRSVKIRGTTESVNMAIDLIEEK